MRVAPRETAKRLGLASARVILPAATDDFHLNGLVPYDGDKVSGIDKSLSKTESGLRVTLFQRRRAFHSTLLCMISL